MAAKRSGGSRVKIDDVARRAGVSTATVSRVINKSGKVSAQTAEKVYRAIGELKYVAHGSARGLASSQTNTIGLILPSISSFFFSELMRGIHACLNPYQYSLLMYAVVRPASIASGNPLPLGEHNTDGLIVFSDFLDDYSIHYLHAQNLPIVMLHHSPPPDLKIPKVLFENQEGGYAATRYLISTGRRRILYLTGPEGNEDSFKREVGYKQALAEAGINFDPDLIAMGGYSIKVAKKMVHALLAQNISFDAIFCGDDSSAVGAVEALREANIEIPTEIAIVGFNDEVLSEFLTPPLTTVRAPIYLSGFTAAQKLLQLIGGEKEVGDSILQTELIVRQSA